MLMQKGVHSSYPKDAFEEKLLEPSPGLTVAPSSCGTLLSSASNDSESNYRLLRTYASEVPTTEGSTHKRTLINIVRYASGFAAGVVCCLVISMSVHFFSTPPQIKQPQSEAVQIWNPDLRSEYLMEPLAKHVVRMFDAYNMARGGLDDKRTFLANVEQYMTSDVLYESVGFGTWSTPAGWSAGEEAKYGAAFPHTIFTQMLFFGNNKVATTTTYGSAFWGGDLLGVKAPKEWVTLRITDFYLMRLQGPRNGKISFNFMMIDWVDAMRQVGIRMLPTPALEEGLVLPPAANDGVPAPLSALVQSQHRDANAARAIAEQALQLDWASTHNSQTKHWHEDLRYYGPGGIGLARNLSQYMKHVVGPFRDAFIERRALVELFACEGNYCAFFGRLSGLGVGRWLGLPTVGRRVSMRFAMHYRVVGDKIQEGWAIFDFPGLFTELELDFYALAAAGGRVPRDGNHI